MKRKQLAVLAAVAGLVLPVSVPGPVHAVGETAGVCSLEFPVHFSPGLTMKTGSGTFASGGENGTMNCIGTHEGHNVTGPGTIGVAGTYTDANCLSSKAAGTSFFTFKTLQGPLRFDGVPFEAVITGLTGTVTSDHINHHITGTFVVVPTKGDCVTTPLTEAVMRVVMEMHG